jgi:hypothetical protein
VNAVHLGAARSDVWTLIETMIVAGGNGCARRPKTCARGSKTIVG